MFRKIFPKIKKLTWIEEICPLLALWPDDKTTVTKGNKFARVIEIEGKDYTGLEPDVKEALFHGRKMFFESLPGSITVLHHSHRQKMTKNLEVGAYSNRTAGNIARKWAEFFTESYRTRHYIIFVTDTDISDQLQVLVKKKDKEETKTEALLISLEDCVADAMVRLQEYGPRELAGDELYSYWGWLLNGKYKHKKMPENGLIDDLLNGTDLRWPNGKRYQIYLNNTQRYSAWLNIKAPATLSSPKLLDHIFKIRREFSIYQSFSGFEKDRAMIFLEDKMKNAQSFLKASYVIQEQVDELQQRIQADAVRLMKHRWAVEVFESSIGELKEAITEIKYAIEAFGYTVSRESHNQEPLFWSRFPELHTYNSRQRFPTSENAAHFATFSAIGQGLDSCTWGPAPVTLFKTETGSEYAFTFHETPVKEALGNTIVIGGSNAGKTTLISFLLSQCFKYRQFKILAFDRLRGMEVFTRLSDGVYQDFSQQLQINPLQLTDSSENRAFLSNWFQLLTGKNEEKDINVIDLAITQLFNELDKSERTLENIADAFGLKEEGSVRKSLDRWLKDGTLEGFFNGRRDAMEFENPLVCFDMTALLDLPEVLGPMTYYLFHKLFKTARKEGGYAVFVDELGKYLASDLFAPKIDIMLEEIRKTEGVFIGAIQKADTVLDHTIAASIKNNISTYILFPEPRADRKHYVDELRLNETEFEWVRKPHPRHVLIKRKDGESVVVNVDLTPLDGFLKVFSSGADSVRKLETLRRKFSDWKTRYLNDGPFCDDTLLD